MNSDQFYGKRHEIKGKVKQKWAKLTDDDVEQISGKCEELSGKIQHRYGLTREDAEKAVQDFESEL